jgi:hypothetical protein
MPPQQPPTLNPLAAISGPQPAPSTEAIDKLRITGVGALADKARTDAANLTSRQNTLNPLGFTVGSFPGGAETLRSQIAGERLGKTAANLVGAGIRVPKGSLLSPGQNPEDFFKGNQFQPGFNLPGQEQSLGLPRSELVDTTETTATDDVYNRAKADDPNLPPGAITKGQRKTVTKRQVKGRDTPAAKRATSQQSATPDLISQQDFEAGVKLAGDARPSDVPVGGIIKPADQARYPGFYKRGKDGEFSRVDIDFSAPAAATAKPDEPKVPRPPIGKKKDKDKVIPGLQNIAPGFVGG